MITRVQTARRDILKGGQVNNDIDHTQKKETGLIMRPVSFFYVQFYLYLRQILPYYRHPAAYTKCFATNANDGTELVTLVFITVHHF
jgi:hypothetical protein